MLSDKEIIDAILAGDKNQFRILIQRYEDKLYGLCIRMLQNRELAEDILQESFIEIYKNLASYKFKSSFSTWAYTITYRRIAKEFKQGKKNLLIDEVKKLSTKDEWTYQEDSFENNDTELLQTAVKSLSPLEHSILSLYYYDEMSVSEMVEITGFSPGKIKTLLFRIRGKLKKKIEVLRKELAYV